jgi:hypothetical protein
VAAAGMAAGGGRLAIQRGPGRTIWARGAGVGGPQKHSADRRGRNAGVSGGAWGAATRARGRRRARLLGTRPKEDVRARGPGAPTARSHVPRAKPGPPGRDRTAWLRPALLRLALPRVCYVRGARTGRATRSAEEPDVVREEPERAQLIATRGSLSHLLRGCRARAGARVGRRPQRRVAAGDPRRARRQSRTPIHLAIGTR